MEYKSLLRSMFADYAATANSDYYAIPATIYAAIDDARRVSYNGSHFTLFLLPSDPKPTFLDVQVRELGSGNLRAWIIPYDYAVKLKESGEL